jgi:hypothetical protein
MIKKEDFKSGKIFYYFFTYEIDSPKKAYFTIKKVKLTEPGFMDMDKTDFFGDTLDEIEINRSGGSVVDMGEYDRSRLFYTLVEVFKKLNYRKLIKVIFYETN